MIHTKNGDDRAIATVKRDSTMAAVLFDSEIHDIEPTFITWDKSFRAIRKYAISEDNGALFWHLFRPAKFLDHLSLLKLDFSPNNLSNEILAIIDFDEELTGKAKSLMDKISKIVEIKSVNGVRLANEIKKIKEYVFDIDGKESKSEQNVTNIYEPFDLVINKLTAYYSNRDSKYNIGDLRWLINETDNVDTFIKIITQQIKGFLLNKEKSKISFMDIDDLIKNEKMKK
jgi:hypothetical protein